MTEQLQQRRSVTERSYIFRCIRFEGTKEELDELTGLPPGVRGLALVKDREDDPNESGFWDDVEKLS